MQVRVYATVLSLFIAAPAVAQTHKIYTPGQWTPLIMENENDPNALPSKPPEWIYKALHAIDTDFQAQEKQKIPFIQVIYGIIKLNNATTIISYMIYGPDMCIAGSNDEPVPCRFHAMTIT